MQMRKRKQIRLLWANFPSGNSNGASEKGGVPRYTVKMMSQAKMNYIQDTGHY